MSLLLLHPQAYKTHIMSFFLFELSLCPVRLHLCSLFSPSSCHKSLRPVDIAFPIAAASSSSTLVHPPHSKTSEPHVLRSNTGSIHLSKESFWGSHPWIKSGFKRTAKKCAKEGKQDAGSRHSGMKGQLERKPARREQNM